jgi:hypothetical protein
MAIGLQVLSINIQRQSDSNWELALRVISLEDSTREVIIDMNGDVVPEVWDINDYFSKGSMEILADNPITPKEG